MFKFFKNRSRESKLKDFISLYNKHKLDIDLCTLSLKAIIRTYKKETEEIIKVIETAYCIEYNIDDMKGVMLSSLVSIKKDLDSRLEALKELREESEKAGMLLEKMPRGFSITVYDEAEKCLRKCHKLERLIMRKEELVKPNPHPYPTNRLVYARSP